MNVFENLKATTFAAVSNIMGTVARWYKDGDLNSQPVEAKVLFNNPTDKEIQGGVDYHPEDTRIEYFKTDWIGLKSDVKDGKPALIEVDGVIYSPHHFRAPKETARDGDMYVLIVRKANL